MANIKNLFVNGTLPKNIYFNGERVKNFYYNGFLVWKNSDLFQFVDQLPEDLSKLEENTLIFEGFGNVFNGEYKTIEDESDIDPNDKGQMYVEVKK